MSQRTAAYGLQVDSQLHRFIETEVLPGTGVDADRFWKGFAAIVHDLAPKNAALLAERDRLQMELDSWHQAHPGPIADMPAYRAFLERIGYLVPVPEGVRATTAHVDDELAVQAGPQLVVPILNARYALNAANARWGSLYDALYGTDAISEAEGAQRTGAYNPVRGAKVIARARQLLDEAVPSGVQPSTELAPSVPSVYEPSAVITMPRWPIRPVPVESQAVPRPTPLPAATPPVEEPGRV